ncbi:recombinase family protein [Streptomyces roseiscleroticus]|uniref:recombinase family protein n=1 Tax=Streptomyces roseiscleroticus TaxID=1972 RepID=UPI0031F91B90
MIQTALYARVSSTKQQQQETIDSQIACLRDEARDRGWEIPGEWVFADDGWSGSNLVRPALERLRDLAAQHLIERVLCLCPDRLACSYAHQVLLIEEFTRSGTEMVFVRNPVATTPEQALMVQVQGMIAEYERAQTAERTRRGKRHRAEAGEVSVLGRAPYGYRYLSRAEYGEAAYSVVETEAAVVMRIFSRYAGGGIAMRGLAAELTAEGIPSPQGLPEWDAGTLGRMLRNPAYMGRAAFGKRQSAGPARLNRTSRRAGRSIPAQAGTRARPWEEWIGIPVPALVTEEVFARVQRRLVENAKFSPRNTKEPVLLQGLLVCDVCGYSYTRTSQGPGPKKYRYYRCPGTNGWELPRGTVCSSCPLRAPALEDLVWQHVTALLSDPALIRRELERELEKMRAAGPVHARQERLRLQIARTDGAIHRLVGAYQEELVTLEELRERVPRLRARRRSLTCQLEALATQLVDQQAYLQLAQNLEDFLARLHERAQTTSVPERQGVLRAVVKEIRIGPDKITIRHSIPSARPDPTPGYLLRCAHLHLVAGPRCGALDAPPDL